MNVTVKMEAVIKLVRTIMGLSCASVVKDTH